MSSGTSSVAELSKPSAADAELQKDVLLLSLRDMMSQFRERKLPLPNLETPSRLTSLAGLQTLYTQLVMKYGSKANEGDLYTYLPRFIDTTFLIGERDRTLLHELLTSSSPVYAGMSCTATRGSFTIAQNFLMVNLVHGLIYKHYDMTHLLDAMQFLRPRRGPAVSSNPPATCPTSNTARPYTTSRRWFLQRSSPITWNFE